VFVRFLLGNRNKLYLFETLVIEAIKSRLDPEAATQLQAQIDSINKVQRLTDGREVNLYCIAHGKPAFDDRLRFPHGEEEALLGTVHLAHSDTPGTLKAEAWLANGRLFSLVFDKPPKRFFAGQALDTVRPEAADVTVWMDPMRGAPKGEEVPVEPAMLSGWLRELFTSCQLTAPRRPLVGPERAARIAQIDAELPPDYLEFTEQMDGAQAGECKIHGLAGVRKVALPNHNFYILAEDDGGALAVKDGSRDGALYRLSYEKDDAQPLNQSFRTALVGFCCRSHTSP
jgi:hypothetical protein